MRCDGVSTAVGQFPVGVNQFLAASSTIVCDTTFARWCPHWRPFCQLGRAIVG